MDIPAPETRPPPPLPPRLTADGVRRGAWQMLPVLITVVPFGIAFGAAAAAKSVAPLTAIAMSATILAGASQFAALELWGESLPIAMLAMTVIAVNARHILYGASLAPWLLQVPAARRNAALAVMTDMNFAHTAAAHERGETDAGLMLGSGLALWCGWVTGTAIGAYAGASLGDLSRYGIDVLMVTFFTIILIGQWKGRGDLLPWLVAAAVGTAAFYALPTGWHIITGALAGGIVGAFQHDR